METNIQVVEFVSFGQHPKGKIFNAKVYSFGAEELWCKFVGIEAGFGCPTPVPGNLYQCELDEKDFIRRVRPYKA
jgi:hypothetical protein